MNENKANREEMMEIFEAMVAIQTLPQWERIALQFYIKGIITAMSGQLPMTRPTTVTETA